MFEEILRDSEDNGGGARLVPERYLATNGRRNESSVRAARRFAAKLLLGETFVDFSNSALIYSLLGRHCPLRHVEVANDMTVEDQREVIKSIERNRQIRAALVAFPGSNADVDGIPNSRRAPLVWSYLQQHFVPAFTQDGVVFWRRSS